MRFSPNPNNLRPKHYISDVLSEQYIGMYEYIDPTKPQKPYFIITNPIGVELDYLRYILDSVLVSIHYSIEHDTAEYDNNIVHVVIHGIYFNDGIIAQQFHDLIISLIPDKIATSFMEQRHNARLHKRYVKLAGLRTSITNIDKIEDKEYIPNVHNDDGWYKILSDYLWLIPSYLTLLLNNRSNA